MHIKAIPTKYNGVDFRSKLEAKWAAMFDLLKWQWEYEPIELNGYIPDFILPFKKPILVEIKPILDWNDPEIETYKGKIDSSGWDGESLLLGALLREDAKIGEIKIVGGMTVGWWDAWVATCCHNNTSDTSIKPCQKLTPMPFDAGWVCRICGLYGKHGFKGDETVPLVKSYWKQAGNAVKWRAYA